MGIGRTLVLAAVVTALLLAAIPTRMVGAVRAVPQGRPTLAGQLLVAAPRMRDPRFTRTVIFMVDHGDKGAMGLVINRVLGSGPLKSFLKGFGVDAQEVSGDIQLHDGGPVEKGLGFILHSSDFLGPGSRDLGNGIALTSRPEILKDIGMGKGPRHSMFVLGYAGWAPGQLEGELARKDWLIAPADADFVFGDNPDAKWDQAIERAGILL
jgi:putative transcriptional regulator